MDKKIGFVGVGRMGANMARRLKDRGHALTALLDSREAATRELSEEIGVEVAPDLSAVTAAADVIFTVVTDDEAMRAIFTEDTLLKDAEGKVFINCATVSPEVHEEIGMACRKVGAHALEACMASSIPQARDGSLYLMVGGEEDIFKKVEPLLQDLSASLRYIGATGKAAQVKALVNMVMNINTAALAEGLGLGQALGLDLEMLCEVFSQTGANSRVLETDADDMRERDHECYFSSAHAAKDSGIANDLADSVGVNVPLSEATESQYRRLIQLGRGELDKSAVAELTFPGRL
ncbi:2-hydroxy-3-oxopropionate reductase [Coraliomargarita sinensis]|uniref:2-hydroxy-3-oxopropionate reductase n=1 Tax=Coraliomargarita sinensis TaxID=2174842 RepID=A0A317ZHV3_9BACT|nr:NAD(P)-dependent oxidoreductase [Coraliomargarita sinensis]PXA05146.1 2-hydroxy-3-oxopropionate reductase [Coraliomargarita sinensis]